MDLWEGDYLQPQTLNGWSYVTGNPLLYTDPTGHQGNPCQELIDWLQENYEKLQMWWIWRNPCTLSVDSNCGIVLERPSPSELAQRAFTASGSPVDPRAIQAAQWADQLAPLVAQFGSTWTPNREIQTNEDMPLTVEQGLKISTGEKFSDIMVGQHGDPKTMYLWTIDEQGVKVAWEQTYFDTPRHTIVHTNLSPKKAFFAGEAWFASDDEIVINAGSGRYGNRPDDPIESARRYELAIKAFEALGYKVTAIPLGQK
jgi:hypothetical protein